MLRFRQGHLNEALGHFICGLIPTRGHVRQWPSRKSWHH